MRRSSPNATLFLHNGYLDPLSAGKQTAYWSDIITALNTLQATCVSQEKTGGWMLIGDNIVASIWSSQSRIDAEYGIVESLTDGIRLLRENTTDVLPNGGS